MSFIDFINQILKPKTREFSWFEIPQDNFIEQSPLQGSFMQDGTYFEIVVHTLFISNQKEYWFEYRPLGVILTRSIYGGSWEELPFVIGPQLLGKIEKIEEGDNITYRNVRVAGPQPYMGDWVYLFTGLWRSPTKNIAEEIISFAETISSAIQTPQLSASLLIANPLVKGLEKLLGMGKLELRIGYLIGFNSSLDPGPSRFRPAYFAMVRSPNINKTNFWVKEDRLYSGTSRETAQPYTDADHILYSIRPLETREDITTFPFYKLWKEAVKKIYIKKDEEADELLDRFNAEMADSSDFTTEHRMKLIPYYKMQLMIEKKKRDLEPEALSESQF